MMLNTSMDNEGLNQLPWNELHLFSNLLHLAGLFRNGTAGLLALVATLLAPWLNCITESRERDDWSANIESFLLIVRSRLLKKNWTLPCGCSGRNPGGSKFSQQSESAEGWPTCTGLGEAAPAPAARPLLTKQIQLISLLVGHGNGATCCGRPAGSHPLEQLQRPSHSAAPFPVLCSSAASTYIRLANRAGL